MVRAHSGSPLGLQGDYILPVNSNDIYFPFYSNVVSGRGHEPELNISSIVPDQKFGQAIAVEDGTTNLVSSFTVYNNQRLPHSLVKLDETFMGMEIWRLTMTPTTDVQLADIRRMWGTGIRTTSPITFKANTRYSASIYYRPVSHPHPQLTVGGVASNIGGWITDFQFQPQGANWYRSCAIRNGTVTTDRTDPVFISTRATNTEINEPIIVDFCGLLIEEGKDWATSFTEGTRGAGRIQYDKELFPKGDFTISVWISHTGDTRAISNSLKLLSLGNNVSNDRLTLWNFCPISSDSQNRRIIADFGNNANGSRQFKDLQSTQLFNPHQWEMLTITFNMTTRRFDFYRNGQFWDSATPSVINPVNGLELSNSGWKYSGLHILSRVVHPSEIKAWYDYGKQLYDPMNYYATWG